MIHQLWYYFRHYYYHCREMNQFDVWYNRTRNGQCHDQFLVLPRCSKSIHMSSNKGQRTKHACKFEKTMTFRLIYINHIKIGNKIHIIHCYSTESYIFAFVCWLWLCWWCNTSLFSVLKIIFLRSSACFIHNLAHLDWFLDTHFRYLDKNWWYCVNITWCNSTKQYSKAKINLKQASTIYT